MTISSIKAYEIRTLAHSLAFKGDVSLDQVLQEFMRSPIRLLPISITRTYVGK